MPTSEPSRRAPRERRPSAAPAAPRPAAAGASAATAALSLSPAGHLLLGPGAPEDVLSAALATRLAAAFGRGAGHGLLLLGAAEPLTALPPSLSFFRDLASRHVAALCALPELEAGGAKARAAPPDRLEELCAHAPPFDGAERLDGPLLARLWGEIGEAFALELAEAGGAAAGFLAALHVQWSVLGRVCFHLAENPGDPARPFAFLATYASRAGRSGVEHRPLGHALRDAGGDRQALLTLLRPVHRAAERDATVKALVDDGRVFRPLALSVPEAHAFLRAVPACEAAGVVVRVPDWWRKRARRVEVRVAVGDAQPAGFGAEALLDFRADVCLDGEPLTKQEWTELRAQAAGLALFRGKWVEVDPARLQALLAHFQAVGRGFGEDGVGFLEGMRLLAGVRPEAGDEDAAQEAWARVVPGRWLEEKLAALRGPEGLATALPGAELKATLRPYQEAGVRWLHLLHELGLGACLADDMGLGKTVQVLALLLLLARKKQRPRSLLVVPASLLANWRAEAARFAPSLKVVLAHPSAGDDAATKAADLAGADLVVTSYGMLQRSPWLTGLRFETVILDEAQAVKNPGARQTRAVKAVKARTRIALTGTPVENRLSDLWSIFDFLVPGLLGSDREFGALCKVLRERGDHGPLRALCRPYLLRRLKTDPAIAPDLPARTEVVAYCGLARGQAALYEERVRALAAELGAIEGIKRRGAVLAALTALKQICNHPAHFTGSGAWAVRESGKLGRLAELCETIAAKREKVLVFTQYREAAGPLHAFLGEAFGAEGLLLHGGTPVAARRALVERFQTDELLPFLVLTVKAGGVGLNLTAASHVIHFDRWWNPAVEDQATDRAHRIGQRRAVLVHKLVCRGTVEEKIDALIAAKKGLAAEVLGGDGGAALTELGNDELLALLRLDHRTALSEA